MSATGQEKPPRREIGSQTATSAQVYWPGPGVAGWSAFTRDEHVPELKGHREITVYDEMLTNPQLWALAIGMLLPITDYDYGLEAGDADPEMTQVLADDLGLPVGLPAPGENAPPIAPGAFRFNFLDHLWEAIFSGVCYGRMYFEQVVEHIPDDGLNHLRRLAPRTPHDISDIITDDDGGLVAIMHPGVEARPGGFKLVRDVPIPVSQLVAYVWLPTSRRRWVGRSMLRPCYEPWILRGRGVRIDMINHERAGGVPGVETDETWQGENLSELRDLASAFRVGEGSGYALPPGAHLKLAKVGGTDVVASLRYHDESMARAWGSMVRQLGSTETGSRALGDTMQGMEAVVRRAIVRWFAATFREHVIEDWWRWNVGPTPHPSLAWRPRDDGVIPGDPGEDDAANPPVARPASALAGRRGDAPRDARGSRAAASGLADPDDTIRVRGHDGRQGHNGRTSALLATRTPDRPLRRGLTDVEVRAAVDFAAMDLAYDAGVDATEGLLANDWLPRLHQAAEDAVAFTKKGTVRKRLTRLNASQISLPAPPVEGLQAILGATAREAAAAAGAELAGMGVPVLGLSDEAVTALVRDQAQALAQMVADGVRLAASRRAVQVNAQRTPGEVAASVREYLDGLAHKWERDQLRGAVQAATNAARLEVFGQVPDEEPVRWYSSEILDASTCGPCLEVDGREFTSLRDAQRTYPFGGFMDCLGGARCRGTVIAVMHEPDLVFPPGLGPG